MSKEHGPNCSVIAYTEVAESYEATPLWDCRCPPTPEALRVKAEDDWLREQEKLARVDEVIPLTRKQRG